MKSVYTNLNSSAYNANTVIQLFLGNWNDVSIAAFLWKVYALASITGWKTTNTNQLENLNAEEVALLFDQLIALVKALEALQEQGGARYLNVEGGTPDGE